MSLLTTKTARSIFYLGCIGGLLVVNSAVVTIAWNEIVAEDTEERQISFLEGTGITAFAYVAVSAIRFSRQPKSVLLTSFSFQRSCTVSESIDPTKDQLRDKCSSLTPEQRDALKRELVERHGCTESNRPAA